jgi:hypothetical protein
MKRLAAFLLMAAAVWSTALAVKDFKFSRLSDLQLANLRFDPGRDAIEDVGRSLSELAAARTGRRLPPPPPREVPMSRESAGRFAAMEGCAGLALLAAAILVMRRPKPRTQPGDEARTA